MSHFKKILFTGLILSCLIAKIANSQSLTLSELLDKINLKDTQILNMKFNFSQEIEISLTKEKYKIIGSVVYKKPDKIYLQTQPVEKTFLPEQLLISDGKKVWIYTPKYKQVIVEKWKSLSKYGFVPEEIFDYVDSVNKLNKNYELEFLGKIDNFFHLSLKPKKRKEIKINFYISPVTYLPEKTELLADTVKVITEIKDVEINTEVKDEFFNFHPPEDVNVLSLD